RLLGLDRPLLAGEPADVAGGLAVGGGGVDEGAGAQVRAEVTAGLLVVLRLPLDPDGGVDSDEGRVSAPLHHPQGLEGGADGARLAAVRMNVDLGARHALPDVVDLGLDR